MSPPHSNSDIIKLTDLVFQWPGSKSPVLDMVPLTVSKGERIFIKGASGSGKTTLLNLLAGVTTASSGSVEVLGQNIGALSSRKRDRFRAQHIGFVFQMFNLLPYLSLIDNVTLACKFSSHRRQKARMAGQSLEAEAERLLTLLRLDVPALKNRPVTQLSVGQQQRVAAARALIGRPEIIIADEPTSALDTDARASFIDLLSKEVTESGATLIFVSHDPGLEPLFDRTIDLANANKALLRGAA